ncbi:MAG TPA: hypothetical protein VGL42_16585 [Opitutaceae bacterium]|jgi:hypothetical protein
MKRSFIVLVAGLAAGGLAHFGWYAARANRLPDTGGLEVQMAWMKEELNLSDQQFSEIKTIHEESSPRLLALSAQVARMRAEYAAFEHERATTGQINFIEFAQFVSQRRKVDLECFHWTQRLAVETSRSLTAIQQEHYRKLLAPILKSAPSLSIN